MFLAKVISTKITEAVMLVKVNLFNRTKEVRHALPFGIDSNPVKGVIAVYVKTGELGADKIIGYLCDKSDVRVGETRIYSTNEMGVQQFYLKLTAGGDIEIGGSSNHMTQWEGLNTQLQAYLDALNTAIGIGVTSAGGAYTPPTALDLNDAKINRVKTI